MRKRNFFVDQYGGKENINLYLYIGKQVSTKNEYVLKLIKSDTGFHYLSVGGTQFALAGFRTQGANLINTNV